MDVTHTKPSAIELKTISAGSYTTATAALNKTNNNNNNNNNDGGGGGGMLLCSSPRRSSQPQLGCCGILGRLLCVPSIGGTAKTATSSQDYVSGGAMSHHTIGTGVAHQPPPAYSALYEGLQRKAQQRRRTPQEVYFESRGKSCKKLLKFNGNSNKILLYPEEGWARTASSSYWTITPCWWQPNRCRIEEFTGTQRRQATKAKMLPLEQGSLLIAGHFRSKKSPMLSGGCNGSSGGGGGTINPTNTTTTNTATASRCSGSSCSSRHKDKDAGVDEFKLYLSSNISMEDYNMGYCLTGFVERRCQQTNTFQMTHFAVIKRQWPSISSDASKST